MIKNKASILAIDCGSGMCTVAIWDGNKVAAYEEEKSVSNQAKMLVKIVEIALASAGIDYVDIGAIACTVGPGSFTGIRIGLATARGIGFAANLQVMGYNSLQILAFGAAKNAPDAQKITAVLNAGKGEIVYQDFTSDIVPLSTPIIQKSAAEFIHNSGTIITGYLSEGLTHPRADHLAEYASLYPQRAVPPVPFYIRPPDAKLPELRSY